jgi:hypothetical protein
MECQLETAPFNEFIWANPVAAEPLQERERIYLPAFSCLEIGQLGTMLKPF